MSAEELVKDGVSHDGASSPPEFPLFPLRYTECSAARPSSRARVAAGCSRGLSFHACAPEPGWSTVAE